MVFYLVVSIIFTIYTLDLLSLVLVAAIAKYKQHGTPKELDARFDKTVEPDGTKELPQYPLCLIQIPMYNEETFCELIIERCCKVKWPRDRLLIQVLDDSTKESVRNKVDSAAAVACEQGHGVEVRSCHVALPRFACHLPVAHHLPAHAPPLVRRCSPTRPGFVPRCMALPNLSPYRSTDETTGQGSRPARSWRD
jgi:cellulose synthase/poly-beta-1,6-N-acetylglucosamine synthase-like glycosyltransferase